MRKVLAGAIELVRFPLMTIEEFAAGPAQSDVLEKEEVVDIFLHFAAPNPKVLDPGNRFSSLFSAHNSIPR